MHTQTKQAVFFHANRGETLFFTTQNQQFKILKGKIKVLNDADEVIDVFEENTVFDANHYKKQWIMVVSENVILSPW
jgi:uncharacterized cupin superfamily protein